MYQTPAQAEGEDEEDWAESLALVTPVLLTVAPEGKRREVREDRGVSPADRHDLPGAGLVASAAGVPDVLPDTGPGQEVKRPGSLVPRRVRVVGEAGVVLLEDEAEGGGGGAGGGRGGRHRAGLESRGAGAGEGGALAALQAGD